MRYGDDAATQATPQTGAFRMEPKQFLLGKIRKPCSLISKLKQPNAYCDLVHEKSRHLCFVNQRIVTI